MTLFTRHSRSHKILSVVAVISLAYSVSAYGFNSIIANAAKFASDQLRGRAAEFSEKPLPIFKGANPKRDPSRTRWWTPKLRADLEIARIRSDVASGENLFASLLGAMVQGAPGGGDGGTGPGEGGSGSGGSGSPGSGGGGPGVGGGGGGIGGTSNSNTGNNLQRLPIVNWAGIGGAGVSFELFHGSLNNTEGAFGPGWGHSYEASLIYTSGSSAIISLPTGLQVPYTESGGTFTRPAGWNHDLVKNSNGSFTMKFKSGGTFEFSSTGLLTATKDANGNTVTITRNSSNQVATVVSSNGRTLTFAYGTNGKVSSVTDPTSRVWTFAYNSAKDLTGIIYPAIGGVTYTRTLTYNSTHDVLSETDLRGNTWSWTYDSQERVTSTTDPLSHTTTFSYGTGSTTTTKPGGQTIVDNYSSGLLASHVDEAGFSKSYTYDSNINALTTTDERGKVWTKTYDSKGNVLTSTNSLGQVQTYVYDSLSHITSYTNELGQTTTATYDSNENLLTVVNPLGKTVIARTYDSLGQLNSSKDALNRTSTFQHDGYGNLSRRISPSGVYQDYVYDSLGFNTQIKDMSGYAWAASYDAWSRPYASTSPHGGTTTKTIDAGGLTTSITDSLGRTTTSVYDAAMRLTSVTNPKIETETTAYNSNNWKTSVTNGRGKVRTFEYTARGEKKKLTMPDGAIEQWTFNGTGQVAGYTSPLGYAISYGFDDAGRQASVTYPSGTNTSFTRDALARPTAMTDASGTTSWTYNSGGQLTQLVQPQGTQTYSYNDAGQRTGMTESGLGTTSYGYDSYGRQNSITNRFSETTTLTYDSLGRVQKRTNANGTEEVNGYDTSSRLTSKTLQTTATQAVMSTENYILDTQNQVTSKTKDGVTTTYTYDANGQLSGESRTGYVCTYTYDANGNRLTKTLNGTTESYTYDDGDKMLTAGSKSYGYDTAGRTTSIVDGSGTTTLNYDYESRISGLSGPGISASYSYNGFDTRVSKVENSVSNTFVRDGVDATASVIRDSAASYTPGISEMRGSTSSFLHSGLKNTDEETTVTGSIAATRTYDAFGSIVASTGAWQGSFGDGGQYGYQEDATGLKLLGHRYYNSSTGRFLTRDTSKVGRNWYVYCNNNPITFYDGSGLTPAMLEGLADLANQVEGFFGDLLGRTRIDPRGNEVVIGGPTNLINPAPNGMTFAEKIHLADFETWDKYVRNSHWQKHEEAHIIEDWEFWKDGIPYLINWLPCLILEKEGYLPPSQGTNPPGHDWILYELYAEEYANTH